MNETTQNTENLMNDAYNAIKPIIMKPINNGFTQFINNTLRLIDLPQKRENVKQQVSIKAHKCASYFGKSIKSIMGDFPPLDVFMTVKSFAQLGVFMISEINNIFLIASLTGIFPQVSINMEIFAPIFNPVLNLDSTILSSLHIPRDLMIDKSLVSIRKIVEKGLNGDQRKIDAIMDTIFVPFITIFLTELFKMVFADFKIPVGSPGAEPSTQYQSPSTSSTPSTQQPRVGGGATRKTRKQKKRLITKYRKSKNNKLRTRRFRHKGR